jgi:putative endonuclease
MGLFAQIWVSGLERGIECLGWIAQRAGNTKPLPAHLETGKKGEQAAFFYLRRKGYVVAATRWSPGHQPGDIDLIAWQGKLLCIIEVKTRTAHDMTAAEVAVDTHKRTMLRRLARQYVRQLPHQTAPNVRFDVISVYLVPGQKKEFEHFEAAFGWNEHEREWE